MEIVQKPAGLGKRSCLAVYGCANVIENLIGSDLQVLSSHAVAHTLRAAEVTCVTDPDAHAAGPSNFCQTAQLATAH